MCTSPCVDENVVVSVCAFHTTTVEEHFVQKHTPDVVVSLASRLSALSSDRDGGLLAADGVAPGWCILFKRLLARCVSRITAGALVDGAACGNASTKLFAPDMSTFVCVDSSLGRLALSLPRREIFVASAVARVGSAACCCRATTAVLNPSVLFAWTDGAVDEAACGNAPSCSRAVVDAVPEGNASPFARLSMEMPLLLLLLMWCCFPAGWPDSSEVAVLFNAG